MENLTRQQKLYIVAEQVMLANPDKIKGIYNKDNQVQLVVEENGITAIARFEPKLLFYNIVESIKPRLIPIKDDDELVWEVGIIPYENAEVFTYCDEDILEAIIECTVLAFG